jgi:hypothetical protein
MEQRQSNDRGDTVEMQSREVPAEERMWRDGYTTKIYKFAERRC